MNVCMLLRGTFPHDVRVRKEATALVKGGHDVVVLCHADDRPTFDQVDGIDVRRVPDVDQFDGFAGVRRAARYLATGIHPGWERALRAALSLGVDVVHVHDLPLVRTALRVRDDVDEPLSVVADLHENYPAAAEQWRGPLSELDWRDPETVAERLCFPIRRLERFERVAVGSADATLAVVEEARDHYVEDCGAPPERVHVVSNTVDLPTFDATLDDRPSVPDGPVLSYVGTLSGRHRGLQTAVDAMPTVLESHPDATLLLVGAGSYEEPLRNRIADRGVGDAVEFTGWVDADRVPGYMAASDVGLVPHLSTEHTNTTVPHKLFQYMAARTPLVTSDADPLRRLLAETEAGETFSADDAESFAAAVDSLLSDPDYADACGARGRAAVEETYNWERDADRLRSVYDSL